MSTIVNDYDEHPRSNMTRILLLSSGIIFILLSIVYNEFLSALFDPGQSLKENTVEKIRSVQISFFLAGLVFISISELSKRIPRVESFMKKTLITNVLLFLLTLVLPIFILELSLRPFAHFTPKTSIYIRDSELGWRLRPGSEDMWGGVKVRINGKGIRGPELDYGKPTDVIRVLYLGDSVTFGYALESHKQTFPYLTETLLENIFKKEIETINAGVGGYSPWQEYIYLSREGIKYSPDLVVASFVLNDVTEKFGLIRFGGGGRKVCSYFHHFHLCSIG